METSSIPSLDTADLRALAEAAPLAGCDKCATLNCPGWEALSASFDEARLCRIGRLGSGAAEPEPTLTEYHPDGSRYWSPNAPIAVDYFPYNRCEVWACRHCGRAFLRYTEYGGYYIEPRIRLIDPALLVATDSP